MLTSFLVCLSLLLESIRQVKPQSLAYSQGGLGLFAPSSDPRKGTHCNSRTPLIRRLGGRVTVCRASLHHGIIGIVRRAHSPSIDRANLRGKPPLCSSASLRTSKAIDMCFLFCAPEFYTSEKRRKEKCAARLPKLIVRVCQENSWQ